MTKLYAHQQHTADFSVKHNRVLDTSDPGTGKTLATLTGFLNRQATDPHRKLLVICPLSIMEPSWGNDISKFTPLNYTVVDADHRDRLFNVDADIYIINSDGVKWIDQHISKGALDAITDICIDEFTSFKNRESQRSKALKRICQRPNIKHITALSGTAAPRSLTDLWHPVYLLDRGQRLGDSFFRFRNQVCRPEVGYGNQRFTKWIDKPEQVEVVAACLNDITVRHRFEDCLDVPPNVRRYLPVELSKEVRAQYEIMREEAFLALEGGEVSAVNAAVKVQKLQQIISGAVYNSEGVAVGVDTARYKLVMELVAERDHSIVGFTWQHEKEGLLAEAKARGLSVTVIDGKVSAAQRARRVAEFQDGKYRALLCHPAAAAHGLTLTRGRATIWSSATSNAEFFQQLNRRIYRSGQTKKTETICIYAENTREADLYEMLDGRLEVMTDLLGSMVTKNYGY